MHLEFHVKNINFVIQLILKYLNSKHKHKTANCSQLFIDICTVDINFNCIKYKIISD